MLKCRLLEGHAELLAGQFRHAVKYTAPTGHEAAEVGSAIDLCADDVIASPQRGWVLDLISGVPPDIALSRLYAGVSPAALNGFRQTQNGPVPAIYSSRVPNRCTRYAAGLVAARRMKQSGHVVVAFSDFTLMSSWAQAISQAGKQSLPVVFIQRNQLGKMAGTIGKSKTKLEYGVTRIPVDGSDVVAVYRVAHEAIRRARQGGGPTLVECNPYRLHDHTENSAMGNQDSVEDPIFKMEAYLSRKGLFAAAWKNRLVRKFMRELDASIVRSVPSHSSRKREPRF